MFKCIVKLFGLPKEITELREIELEIEEGAGMADIVAALRKKIPKLQGPVIRPGENRLQERYKFNINGTFYFDGMDFKLNEGDKIALLTPITGG